MRGVVARVLGVVIGIVVGVVGTAAAQAVEESGMTSATIAATAEVVSEPSTEQIHQAISRYISEVSAEEGAFLLDDELTGETRELTLVQIHEGVQKHGDYASACVDMKDVKSGETLDVDFDVESFEGEVEVVDIRVHKVNGKERFSYDDHSPEP